MIIPLNIADFLSQSKNQLVIDVRSPKEFEQGHIPNALNLPLFTNEERALVGTAYKKNSKEKAIEIGLEIVGPKMAEFVRFVRSHCFEKKVFVYCWRGGMRSGSMAWLFDMSGFETVQLKDGYKSYRNFVLEKLSEPFHLMVLGGRTGTAKTYILHELEKQQEQTIDLEKLANHKGSAFGSLGEKPQPSTEHFENKLVAHLLTLDVSKRIWIEDESKNVGKCFLQNAFWETMRFATLIVIERPMQKRIQHLVSDYTLSPVEEIEACVRVLEKRLGNESMKTSIAFLHENKFEEATEILLKYYDRTYDHALSVKPTKNITYLSFEEEDNFTIAQKLILHADIACQSR